MHLNVFSGWLVPGPAVVAYSDSPDPSLDLGEGRGRGGERRLGKSGRGSKRTVEHPFAKSCVYAIVLTLTLILYFYADVLRLG